MPWQRGRQRLQPRSRAVQAVTLVYEERESVWRTECGSVSPVPVRVLSSHQADCWQLTCLILFC